MVDIHLQGSFCSSPGQSLVLRVYCRLGIIEGKEREEIWGKAEQNFLEPNKDTSYPGFWDDQIRFGETLCTQQVFFSLYIIYFLFVSFGHMSYGISVTQPGIDWNSNH